MRGRGGRGAKARGDWGLGIGDWGLGVGGWGLGIGDGLPENVEVVVDVLEAQHSVSQTEGLVEVIWCR